MTTRLTPVLALLLASLPAAPVGAASPPLRAVPVIVAGPLVTLSLTAWLRELEGMIPPAEALLVRMQARIAANLAATAGADAAELADLQFEIRLWAQLERANRQLLEEMRDDAQRLRAMVPRGSKG